MKIFCALVSFHRQTRVTRTNSTSFSIPGLCQRSHRTNWPDPGDPESHPTFGFCMRNVVFDVLLLRVALCLMNCVIPQERRYLTTLRRKVSFGTGKLFLVMSSIFWSTRPSWRIVCLFGKSWWMSISLYVVLHVTTRDCIFAVKNVYPGYCFRINHNNGNKGTLLSTSSALDASWACILLRSSSKLPKPSESLICSRVLATSAP